MTRLTPVGVSLAAVLLVLGAAWVPSLAFADSPKLLAFLTSTDAATARRQRAALIEGLRAQGLDPGRNIELIDAFADHDYPRVPELALRLIKRRPDVIVSAYAGATLAAIHAADHVPVVFAAVSDPVGNGIVKSLAHPGGNATGVATNYAGFGGKRLELLKDAFPKVSSIALLYHKKYASACELEIGEVEAAARTLGLKVEHFPVTGADQLAGAFQRMKAQGANALYVPTSPLVAHVPTIVLLARKHNLPAVYDDERYVEEGGLMSFGADEAESLRRAARYAARILRRRAHCR